MSTSAPDYPRASDIRFEDDVLVVFLEDGRELRVPLDWFPTLLKATAEERADWTFIGGGIGVHWPRIDEDLSIRGMLLPHMARVRDDTA